MARPAAVTGMVDRHRETEVLRTAIADAARGIGSAVTIVGAAGVGKTRLAREGVRLALDSGYRCAWGAGWPDGGSPPLWPWAHLLSQLGGSPSELYEGDTDTSERDRFTTFRAMSDAILAVAADQPVLLVIDDAHEADAGSLLLARFLVRAIGASRIVVVTCTRDLDVVEPRVATALGNLMALSTVLKPAALTVEGVAELLRQNGETTPRERAVEIHALTGGNPYLVGELVAAGSGTRPPTTDRVRSILEVRLRRVPPATDRVLVAVTLLGPLASPERVVTATGLDRATGRELLRSAELAGILVNADDGTLAFAHRLLADAFLATQEPDALADVHEAIADGLESESGTPAQIVATAHHRVEAASIRRDPASVAAAQSACQHAASALTAANAYEAAATLLSRAIALWEAIGAEPPPALVLDVSRSELSAGNLRASRVRFRRLVDLAHDPVELAEAAVGLGGIWVREHRVANEHAAYMGLLERARRELGNARPDLAVRMRVRVAAESIYSGSDDHDELQSAVRAARDIDDGAVLAEALSLLHHTLLGPARTDPARLAIADELISVAAASGEEVLALMGMLWRAVDLLLMGDRRAGRAVAELRERAGSLHVGAVLFVIDAIDVMSLLRRGEIDEAERAAVRCFELGTEIGDADAVGFYGGHVMAIGFLRGRAADVLPLARTMADSPALLDGDVAPLAASAVLAAMIGENAQAEAAARDSMSRLRGRETTSSNWLITMFCLAEAAALLDDRKCAAEIYSSLLPYRHLPVMGSIGVVCLGSVERSLGVVARTSGDLGLAIHHFENAIIENQRLGNRVFCAISDGSLGCALLERGGIGDIGRGSLHVDTAITSLNTFGLPERATDLRATADRLLLALPAPDGRISRDGTAWRLAYDGRSVVVPDSIGVRRLCHLLHHPFVDVTVAELVGEIDRVTRHDVSDTAALLAYRRRIDELREEIDAADDDHDLGRAADLRSELDDLLEHLRPVLGLRSNSRTFADPTERARMAVRQSLTRVFRAIGDQDAEFAERLAGSVQTGLICRFEPVDRFPSVWLTANDD